MQNTLSIIRSPRPNRCGVAVGRHRLDFRPSPEATLGVELELQILDARTGDLAPGSVRLLEACAREGMPGVTAELMQSMIEARTGICRDVTEVRDQLYPTLRRMGALAESLGYRLAPAGTHPFHQSTTSVVFPRERYERILERLAWLAYQRVVFGLHVHVGVPGGDEAVGVMGLLTPYLPHLLALSANSPFWHEADTGLASARAALYNLLPHAGPPPFFEDWEGFCRYCQVMEGCQVIGSFKDVYWDIRPRPDFGTVEFRICDTPATLATALGLVALTRCLVIWALRALERDPGFRRRDRHQSWIAVENRWLATRYGLSAPYIRTVAGDRRPLVLEVRDVLEQLRPIARETGDEPFLEPLLLRDSFEPGSERQRRVYRDTGSWRAVMDDLSGGLAAELAEGEVPAARPAPNHCVRRRT